MYKYNKKTCTYKCMDILVHLEGNSSDLEKITPYLFLWNAIIYFNKFLCNQ